MTWKLQGRVKFYSSERGYGFIATDGRPDVFFHITSVTGDAPPKVGDYVSYALESYDPAVKAVAKSIEVKEPNPSSIVDRNPEPEHGPKLLTGFPCIRSDSIRGFYVEEDIGRLDTRSAFWGPEAHTSVAEAKEKLISMAEFRGANAIFEYCYHRGSKKHLRGGGGDVL